MIRRAGGGPARIAVLGPTGTIGRATVRAFSAHGYSVLCLVRPGSRAAQDLPEGVEIRAVDISDVAAIRRTAFPNGGVDAVVSCLASRTGAPRDAWAIDHDAHQAFLQAAQDANVTDWVHLSAICLQRPRLDFQHAKLAFEASLRASSLAWTIIRPTAFFKSLSGQVARVKDGKPFLVFGDGRMTACKPISDRDLAEFLVGCFEDRGTRGRILPIGGPGPAITPRDQGEALFRILGHAPRFRHMPIGAMDAIIWTLATLGRVSPGLAAKAELARIGRYYATESMLAWDAAAQAYAADATPETGSDTLFAYYADLIDGRAVAERRDHAVF